jgi:DNA adenine methylase
VAAKRASKGLCSMTVTRPALRYHGGKWKLAPWIIDNLPPHRIYVEPYGGACSVLLRKKRSYSEVYNDLDGEVVAFFRVLRDPVQADRLRQLVTLTPFSRLEFEGSYEVSDCPVEQARRTLARSFMGFGSNSIQRLSHGRTGFRASALRYGTVPAMDWSNWPDHIPAFVDRLRGVSIECRDAVDVIAQQDSKETLFYVDPPYVHSTRSRGKLDDKKHFYFKEMTDADHRILAKHLNQVRGMVVISGYPCELYDNELYSTWHRISRHSLADGARSRTEVLWLNSSAMASLGGTQTSIDGVA